MTINTNFPVETTDSADSVKTFFNSYFTEPITLSSNDVDSVIGFFQKRGFEDAAAISTAIVLLQQAKLDNVKIFELLDTLKGLSDLQISSVIAEILNYNRQKTSSLGYKQTSQVNLTEKRNVIL